ncbi:hypothetical protein ASE85_02545 [Sphingobium sp. Leaf26]|uniref:hypothetical protein n=1 Tax=Sphingobium sp. Leaf26 TaxID=1735693 RepID=UPI0006F401A1|nr:hypothetical protein [Sphingobium sp. Leaf26]KQN09833.1 hypothetical protein ASE85_02545 [Sphingobium sp. Leaf26]
MTDPIAVSITASMIAAKIECASYLADDHPTVQLLARFEAETRKDERDRCAEVADDKAAYVAALIAKDGEVTDARIGVQMAYEVCAAAIRNLGEG